MRAALHSTLIVAVSLGAAGCMPEPPRARVAGGDENRGRTALAEHGCGACHVIPGVRGADGRTGPPLASYSRFAYLAGKFPQQPELLAQWIADPASLAPRTAMPAVPMSEQQARDMAAYLYSLD